MPGIDQILSIVSQQGADELRLAADEEPQVFASGLRKRFVMSATSEPVLRHLLGDLVSGEREIQLAATGHLQFEYRAKGIGRFQVTLETRHDKRLEVVFTTASAPRPEEPKPQPALTTDAPIHPIAAEISPLASSLATQPLDTSSVNADPGGACTFELENLVTQAIEARASDIHLADNEPVYLRIDGQLQRLASASSLRVDSFLSFGDAIRERLLAGQAVEFSLDPNPRIRLRVSVFRTASGLAAAVRLLHLQAPSLKSLNLPVPLENLAQIPHGLVLVCGATGAGKSSTLAALGRQALESRSITLLTLEDPIEYQLTSGTRSLVRQRQLGRDVRDFASGLREALRSDPDVILVGELRDAETIRLALTGAETGHLVLASIHSGSASSCVERIIDAYPSEQRTPIRVQLADALRAVVVQKLLPSARGQGRVAALEVLRVNHAAANVIREGKTAQLTSVIQSGGREGMLNMERCLANFVQSGAITLAVARDAANDLDALTMYLGK